MRKKEERQLMRQKINVTDALIQSWKAYYLNDIRHLIHPSLMKEEDIGSTFEHQGRTFEIVGMSFGGTLMLRETCEEGIFYWECTRSFVQMKLGRFNQEFFKVKGKLMTRDIAYPEPKMYLSPLNRKPKKEEVEVEDQYTDEYEEENEGSVGIVGYNEDGYDDPIED
jgi:hypothetical protein